MNQFWPSRLTQCSTSGPPSACCKTQINTACQWYVTVTEVQKEKFISQAESVALYSTHCNSQNSVEITQNRMVLPPSKSATLVAKKNYKDIVRFLLDSRGVGVNLLIKYNTQVY